MIHPILRTPMPPLPSASSTPCASSPSMALSLSTVGALGLCISLLGLFLCKAQHALSIIMGALLAFAHLFLLTRMVSAFLSQALTNPLQSIQKARKKTAWTLLALLKLCFLFAWVVVLFVQYQILPLFLIIGYMSLPLGIVMASIWLHTLDCRT